MKKYMIRCDMEGVTGVVSPEQAEPGRPEFPVGRHMFMSDLSAMVRGLLDGGADEISVYDEHYFGRNIDLTQMPEHVNIFSGKPPYTSCWAGGLDESFDGLLLLGFHSMAGTGELLCHTYEPEIQKILINGLAVGEIGVETAVAGQFGVPLLMVTADSAGVEEAKRLVPNAVGISVKKSLGENAAICYPPDATAQWIREAAKKAALEPPRAAPFRTEGPVVLEVQLKPGEFWDRISKKYPAYAGDHAIVIQKDTVLEAYALYWEMKLACQ